MTIEREPGVLYRRPWTEPVRLPDGGTRFKTKRACNGCDRYIGDGSLAEINAVLESGGPDVRAECPWCSPCPCGSGVGKPATLDPDG